MLPPRRSPRTTAALLTVLLTLAPVPAAAVAKDGGGGGGGGESRARADARCGHAARTRLDLRGRDGDMRLGYELEHGRAGESWRIVVVQEGGVVWRRTLRISRSGAIEVRLDLRDLPGADRVEVRASGPRGTTCGVATTLRG